MADIGQMLFEPARNECLGQQGRLHAVCRRRFIPHRDKESEIELDIDNQYILSPKDLKTIHFINRMMEAGVRVFKIEGRARSANMCVRSSSVIAKP